MFEPRLFAMFVACASLSTASAACALGEPEEPGCQSDTECGAGLVCRAGACFRLVGEPASPDLDAGDAG